MTYLKPYQSVGESDAVITNIPRLGLLVKQADCQAVFLYDPINRVIASVHCGWRGQKLGLLGLVVQRMEAEFGCSAANMLAAIGPSLGPCCAEFITHKEIFPAEFTEFMIRDNYFDLWALSRRQLLDARLKSENIETAEICTRCRTDLFFSYRAEGVTGRFASVAMLTEPGSVT